MINHKNHTPKLIQSHHINIHGEHLIGRFNNWVAVRVTNVLSSMWFFWFCVVLDLVELPAVASSGSVVAWVTYIAQTVIQLLALPAISAGQKLISAAQDARAEADHETLTAIHALTSEVHTLTERQMDILKVLEAK